ncbi:LysE family translocator [Micromonospora narathiwatensis]|uniref:Resistance to homoserine/threonine (RhtB) family protein n=1 Tax=Micromonospora narathiwatensis TaxID=299146 RepID=A0A1A9ADP1_9ACTN|nr:LysE family translocator [Micromonospora narathiwatensis]SBT54638.1 resistance to homoserine/threonine (RhtB) family protein [Micromonospora narathiwatensis]
MSWSSYASFLVFALVLVLIPGPDFAVVTRNTLAAGRRRGRWSAIGVASSNAVQGGTAAAGLGALVVRSQPLFETIRWAGVAYLLYLGVQAWRSAWRGSYPPLAGKAADTPGQALTGFRQGFLSNITNPKVLAFYLAVLPQFVGPSAPLEVLLAFAFSHAVLSLTYLMVLVTALNRVRLVLSRRRVRRWLDGLTGVALLGFGARLAAESA